MHTVHLEQPVTACMGSTMPLPCIPCICCDPNHQNYFLRCQPYLQSERNMSIHENLSSSCKSGLASWPEGHWPVRSGVSACLTPDSQNTAGILRPGLACWLRPRWHCSSGADGCLVGAKAAPESGLPLLPRQLARCRPRTRRSCQELMSGAEVREACATNSKAWTAALCMKHIDSLCWLKEWHGNMCAQIEAAPHSRAPDPQRGACSAPAAAADGIGGQQQHAGQRYWFLPSWAPLGADNLHCCLENHMF